MELKVSKKKLCLILVGVVVLTCITGILSFKTPGFLANRELFFYNTISKAKLFYRCIIILFVYLFLACHIIFDVKKFYAWLFKYRWLLGGITLLVLTALRFNGESITFYYENVQSKTGDSLMTPILGTFRGIRSDQFVATTPSVLASSFGDQAFGLYNYISRGTKTLNVINGVFVGFSTLAYAPWQFAFKILPLEYAYSFNWYAPIILSFLMSTELFYIITKKKKLLSIMGGFLLVSSPWYLWWNFPTYLISAPGTVVCLHYFLNNKNFLKKIGYGIGIAICFAMFVIRLYPAWQVPFGYVYLIIGLWCLYINWERIKEMDKKSWLLLILCVAFMVSLIGYHFLNIREYTAAIMETVYPGKRVGVGGYVLQKMFFYLQQTFYAYFGVDNPCETSTFFSLFPIPLIVGLYCWIRHDRKSLLLPGLLLVSIPMLIYCTIGFPEIIAKLTLFSYSTPERLVDILGYVQIFLIVIILSEYGDKKRMPLILAFVLAACTAGYCYYITDQYSPGYLPIVLKAPMALVIFVFGFLLSYRTDKRFLFLFEAGMSALAIFTGVLVHPVLVGLGPLTEKPLSLEIRKIVEEDQEAKWISVDGGIWLQQFAIANGAPTINALNAYPNMELWQTLDPENQYTDVYNRYAHVSAVLIHEETNFELVQPDYMLLSISYKDLEKTGVKYVLSQNPAAIDFDNGYVKFTCIYEESGAYIYEVTYLNR